LLIRGFKTPTPKISQRTLSKATAIISFRYLYLRRLKSLTAPALKKSTDDRKKYEETSSPKWRKSRLKKVNSTLGKGDEDNIGEGGEG